MKLTQSILALAIVVLTATAQLSSLPTCAQSCATDAIPSSCGVDVACICGNKSFLSDIACCIVGKCTTAEQEQTLKAAKGICLAGGVTDLPSTVACTTGASSTTTASSASTTSSQSTTTGTTTATGTTAATGSETTVSGTAATASTTESASTSTSGTLTTSTTSSAASSASSAAATTGGAALGQNQGASFMAAAGVAAAFAILV